MISKQVENLMFIVNKLSLVKQEMFADYYASGLYSIEQLTELCRFLQAGYNVRIIENPSMSVRCMGVLYDMLFKRCPRIKVGYISKYDEDIIDEIYTMYIKGVDLLPFIDSDSSQDYVEFLFDIVDKGYDIRELPVIVSGESCSSQVRKWVSSSDTIHSIFEGILDNYKECNVI